jgi:hypothetical protein
MICDPVTATRTGDNDDIHDQEKQKSGSEIKGHDYLNIPKRKGVFACFLILRKRFGFRNSSMVPGANPICVWNPNKNDRKSAPVAGFISEKTSGRQKNIDIAEPFPA